MPSPYSSPSSTVNSSSFHNSTNINSVLAQKMSNSQEKTKSFPFVSTVANWLMLALLLLLPTLVIPLTDNFLFHSKLFLILFGAIAAALLYFLQSFTERVWKVVVSPLTIPLVIFGLSLMASIFFTQGYPVENLLGIGGSYLAAVLLALIGPSLIDSKKVRWVVPVFIVSVCVVNLASLLQLVGWGPTKLITMLTGFELDHSLVFNLSLSSLVAIQLGLIALVGGIGKIISTKKIGTFEMITLPTLLFGIGLHLWSIMPGQPAQVVLPSLSASWSVALDSLRVPKAALIGQGTEGYLSAFSRYRPTALNTSQYWQLRFDSALGAPLTMLVQTGFLGLIAWLFLAGRFVKNALKNSTWKSSPLTLMLLASFGLQFFLPANILLVGLQGLLLAFWIAQFGNQWPVLKLRALSASLDSKELSATAGKEKTQAEKFISLFTNGVLIAGVLLAGFFVGRAYLGFHHLYLAEKALLNNDAVGVYEKRQRAMVLNPYLDSLRRNYALTNLQIAIALAEKTDLTEEEQAQVSQLIQQAVREAQAATTIDPQDTQNWTVLAQVYQQLIGSVEEADQWAVNAYVNAIQTDPSNPLLRIQLGSVLLQQQQLQQAANLFSQAIELKPDLASGYFYLGQTQALAQDFIGAQRSWQQALALVESGTEDYQTLEKLLEEIQPQVEQAQAALQAQEQQQAAANGTVTGINPEDGDQLTSPLGQQLPSLTDQNIENRENIVSQPGTADLNLPETNADLINQETPVTPEITEETAPATE